MMHRHEEPDPARSRENLVNLESERGRRGYIQELMLANLIMAASPDEIVLHYGNPVGVQGPDAVSIGPDRLVSKWDTGWRRIEQSFRPSNAAADSVDRALIDASVWKEIASGRLSAAFGLEVLRNFDRGNYNNCIVGQGDMEKGLDRLVGIRNRGSGGQ
jgi:hypothetical protein